MIQMGRLEFLPLAMEVHQKEIDDSFNLWQQNIDIVTNVVKNSFFIPGHEREDYIQDIFIRWVTKAYPGWKQKGVAHNFRAWFYTIVKRAALACWVKNKKAVQIKEGNRTRYRCRVRMMPTDDFSFYTEAIEEYSEHNLLAMDRVIDDLSEAELQTIRVVLSDETLLAASAAAGRTHTHYYTRFRSLREKIISQKEKYNFRIKVASHKVYKPGSGNGKKRKPVIQLDKNFNKIKVWGSLLEAEKIGGYSSGVVSLVASGKKSTHKGFYWIFCGENRTNVIDQFVSRLKRPIRQLTLDGVLIKEYLSLRDAVNSGYSEGPIKACVERKKSTYLGFRWEYIQRDIPDFRKIANNY